MSERPFIPEGKTEKQISGHIGEEAVARRYEAEGYTVIGRNVHMSRNELDLILTNDTHIVFVEVKTRHARPGARSRYGRPADAVDKGKRARTVAAAEAYLRERRAELTVRGVLLQPRIDIAEVYMVKETDGTERIAEIIIFRNAFGAR